MPSWTCEVPCPQHIQYSPCEIYLPRVSCENMMEEKCFMVPEIMDNVETVEKCEVMLGAPDCRRVELSLPRQVCRQIDYSLGYNKV